MVMLLCKSVTGCGYLRLVKEKGVVKFWTSFLEIVDQI